MARRDLDNLVAKRDRRRKREDGSQSVELLPGRRIDSGDGHADGVSHRVARVRTELLPIVTAGLSDGERRCLDLLLDGEKKTILYAKALGISDLPAAERKAAVKRVKDKLKSRIRRARRNHDVAS